MPRNIIINKQIHFKKTSKHVGFTIAELLIAIAIVSILSAIAAPSLNNFLVKMRVDNEIAEMQRLLLTARNTAINSGKNTTVCPLTSANVCGNDWTGVISVFDNNTNVIANNTIFTPASERVIKVKNAIRANDQLQFPFSSIIYTPSGRIVGNQLVATLNYCPNGHTDSSRGISISISGRVYNSSDIDNDGKDEDRTGNAITCS